MELLKLYNIKPIYLLGTNEYIIEYNIDDYYDLFLKNLPEDIYIFKKNGDIPTKLEKKDINQSLITKYTEKLPNIHYTTDNYKIINILLLSKYTNFELDFNLNKNYERKYNSKVGYNKYYFDNYYFDNYDYKLEIYSNKNDCYKFNYKCTMHYGTLEKNGTLSMNGRGRFRERYHKNYDIKYKYELIINKNTITRKYTLLNKNNITMHATFLNLLNFYYTCYKLKDLNNYETKIIDSILKIKKTLTKQEIEQLISNIKNNIRIPENKFDSNKNNLIKKVKNNLIKKVKSNLNPLKIGN